jgi:hypothetical protein
VAYLAGTGALVVILFAGGLQTPLHVIRGALAPAGVLATLGVVGVAGLTAVGARLLGAPWDEALLVGAIVSSTDAAAVFTVLQGVRLPERVARCQSARPAARLVLDARRDCRAARSRGRLRAGGRLPGPGAVLPRQAH